MAKIENAIWYLWTPEKRDSYLEKCSSRLVESAKKQRYMSPVDYKNEDEKKTGIGRFTFARAGVFQCAKIPSQFLQGHSAHVIYCDGSSIIDIWESIGISMRASADSSNSSKSSRPKMLRAKSIGSTSSGIIW